MVLEKVLHYPEETHIYSEVTVQISCFLAGYLVACGACAWSPQLCDSLKRPGHPISLAAVTPGSVGKWAACSRRASCPFFAHLNFRKTCPRPRGDRLKQFSPFFKMLSPGL